MKLIEQYIHEVGANLPEKKRADLEKEIRSLIEDTLEERSETSGRAIDDEMVVEVLKEFGPPAKMAGSYLPAQYLIGPRLYPTFIMVLKIVSAIMLVLAVIGLVVDAVKGTSPYQSVFELILGAGGTLVQSLLAALGNVVFVFAIVERFVPQGIEKEKDWDPRTMQAVEEPDKVSRVEQVWIIFWSSVAILLFNFYPQLLRFGFIQNGEWYWYNFLSDTFFGYIPALTVLWSLEIFLCILLFRAGTWQKGTRWFKAFIKGMNVVLLAVIIAGPPIFTIITHSQSSLPGVLQTLTEAFPSAYLGFRIFLAVILVFESLEFGKTIYHAITSKPFKLLRK